MSELDSFPTWGSEPVFDAIVDELIGVHGNPFDIVIEPGEARLVAARIIGRLRRLGRENDMVGLPQKRWWRRSQVNLVKGGSLQVGDKVLIPCEITEIDDYKHPIARPVRGSHWSAGDQHLWTWGGQYGAGIDCDPSIYRVMENTHV